MFFNPCSLGPVEHTTLCGEKEVPDSVTANINGTFSKKIDENANGVWEADAQGDFDDFALDVTVRRFEPSSCVPTNFAVPNQAYLLSGAISRSVMISLWVSGRMRLPF